MHSDRVRPQRTSLVFFTLTVVRDTQSPIAWIGCMLLAFESKGVHQREAYHGQKCLWRCLLKILISIGTYEYLFTLLKLMLYPIKFGPQQIPKLRG